MSVDLSAFSRPVTSDEVRQFRAQAKASGAAGYRMTAQVVTAIFFAVAGIAVFLFVSSVMVPLLTQSVVGTVMIVAAGVVLVVIVVTAIPRITAFSQRWENWFRLSSFAQTNGFLFSPLSGAPSYPGMIFAQGRDRKALNHVRATTGRYFDVGNFQYTVGSGKNQRTYDWGFLAFKLDRALPHMLLDAKSNNNLLSSNLPTLFSKDQVLSLEGNFDDHFTLYCPAEYERDALYVFTPDLMALLIDEAAPFDVEIVDDWMFVYSSKPFSPAQPGNYERMFRVIDTVGAKTLRQTARYSDERVAGFSANVIAPPGRRLKTRVSVLAIVLVVVVVGVNVWSSIADVVGW